MTQRKVLVFGDDTRSFLTIVRSLGRAGWEVHAAPLDHTAPALRSCYLTRVHALPGWIGTGQAWLDATEALLRAERFDLVIPCTETSLLPLARNRARFGQLSCLALPDDASIETLFDKAATRDLATRVGMPIAPGQRLSPADDADALVARLGLPLMLKPRASYTLDTLDARGKVETIRDAAELAERLAAIDRSEYLAEAFFPQGGTGHGVGLSVLADQGQVVLEFAHRRIRETSAGGSYYRVSIPADPEMRARVAAMLAELRFTGVAMFEFRASDQDGSWVLLEVNARPWGSMPLPVALGVDFPKAWARLLLEGMRPDPVAYRHGVYGRNFLPDAVDLGHAVLPPRAGSLRRLVAWLAEFPRLLIGREHWDVLVADDPRPGLIELATKLRDLVAGLGAKLPGASRLRRNRARAALRRAVRQPNGTVPVLEFVCAGNICRSPFAAQALAARLAGHGVSVRSSGTLPRPGRPTPEEGLIAARDLGIDLTDHRSAYFNEDRAAAADLVLAFDERNVQALTRRFPHLAGRIVLLGDFDQSGRIADPWGGPVVVFAACYDRISRAITALAAEIASG